MKVLLFGSTGQVGRALALRFGSKFDLVSLERNQVDFEKPAEVQAAVLRSKAEVVINAAAYTAVDKAESEPDLVRLINAVSPGIAANAAAAAGALMIHYSTDYVFDGTKATSYLEGDTPNPLSVYGQTKLDGEREVAGAGGTYLIFRTSWVHSPIGTSFCSKILARGQTQRELSVVDDQFGAPTSADLIAATTLAAVERFAERKALASGIYHLVASGEANWHEYAQYILEYARLAGVPLMVDNHNVRPVPASDFMAAASRPQNSRLATDKLRRALGLDLPHWRKDLEPTLRALSQRILNG